MGKWPSETHFWQREVCCFSHLAICQQFSDFPLVLVAWQPGAGAIKPWPVLFQAQTGKWFIGGTVRTVNPSLRNGSYFFFSIFFFKPGVYTNHIKKKYKRKKHQLEGLVVKIFKHKIKAYSELLLLCRHVYRMIFLFSCTITLCFLLLYCSTEHFTINALEWGRGHKLGYLGCHSTMRNPAQAMFVACQGSSVKPW